MKKTVTPRRIRFRADCGHIAAFTVTTESKQAIAIRQQVLEMRECASCVARRVEGDPDEKQRTKLVAIVLHDQETACELIADQLEAQGDLVRGQIYDYDSEENGLLYMLSLASGCVRKNNVPLALRCIEDFLNKKDGMDHTTYLKFEAGATLGAKSANMLIRATFKLFAPRITHFDSPDVAFPTR